MPGKKAAKLATAVVVGKTFYHDIELIQLQFEPPLVFLEDWKTKPTKIKINHCFCAAVDFSDETYAEEDECYLEKRLMLFGVTDDNLPNFLKVYGLSYSYKERNTLKNLGTFMTNIGYSLIDSAKEEIVSNAKAKLSDAELDALGLTR